MSKNTNINHLATLANLPLGKNEATKLEKDINDILSYVDQIQELDLESVEPTNQVTGKENELRDDVVSASLPQKDALKHAAKSHQGYFVVERVIHYD